MTQRRSSGVERLVFVDTSAFFAMASQRDADHAAARRVLEKLERERLTLLTTTYVVAETHALFLSRRGREAGVAFLANFMASGTLVVRPDIADEEAGRGIVFRYTDKTYSLTDAISFAVMERLGIDVAFTFDRDFERYGFRSVSQ